MNIYRLYWVNLILLPIFLLIFFATINTRKVPLQILQILFYIIIFLFISFIIISLICLIRKIKNKQIWKAFLSIVFNIFIVFILYSLFTVNTGGGGAKDARIEAGLDQLRTSAEVYKSSIGNNSYNNSGYDLNLFDCSTHDNSMMIYNGDIIKACNAINGEKAGGIIIRIKNGKDSNAKYCVQKTLNAGGSFCVDFTGYMGEKYNYCDNVNFTCTKD